LFLKQQEQDPPMMPSRKLLPHVSALCLGVAFAPLAWAENSVITAEKLETLLQETQDQAEAQSGAQSDSTSTQTAASGSDPVLTAQQIDAAAYENAPLAKGRSALTVKVQVLLDRAGISPGVIDGYSGGMSETAMRAFEARAGLPVDGKLDADLWAALNGPQSGAITDSYTITAEDVAQLSEGPLPTDYAELAKLDKLGYTRVSEAVSEKFHMDEDFLKSLNPEARWEEGARVTVVNVQSQQPGSSAAVARIVVDKSRSRLQALDASGAVLADYPVTIGSEGTPSPSGTHKVLAVAENPTYSYNPDLNFKQGDNDEFLTLPPGPNGPVGSMWIDLDKPTYGLHGTSEPAELFSNQSHGCVRMTNWDAGELGQMVTSGLQSSETDIEVEFRE
jgi:lipoprotein-anchoring transpeptidase ErfK/SrfK